MSDGIWLRLAGPAEDDAALAWARVDASGRVVERGEGSAAELAGRWPAGIEVRAVVAAERLYCTRLVMPGGRLLRGAPLAYALEDRLAAAPESVHAVAGRPGADGRAAVVVVDSAWLVAMLAGLERAGIRPRCLLAEPSLTAPEGGTWCLVWSVQPFLHTGEAVIPLPVSAVEAGAVLRLALGDADQPPGAVVLRRAPGQRLPLPEMAGDATKWVEGPEFDWATAAHQAAGQALDLRQGPFAGRSRRPADLRAWRPVAWLAGALLAVNGLGALASLAADAWEAKQLRAAQRNAYLASFPQAKVVVDPLLQMRRGLAELRRRSGEADGADFLPLVQRVGALLPAAARAQSGEIRYAGGALTLHLPATAAEVERLSAAGLRASAQPGGRPGWLEIRVEAVR